MGQKRKLERLMAEIVRLKEQIERQNELIKKQEERIKQLEAKLAKYENPHTPPSLIDKKPRPPSNGDGKPGQKEGHEGITRAQPEPTERVESKLDTCPDCYCPLGTPIRTERRIIEEIPEPQPVRVIEYTSNHYWCEECQKEIIASSSELPKRGRFGKNVITETVLMKFEDRLPVRKVREALERQYGLRISPGTIFDFTVRANQCLQSEYFCILTRIRNSPWVHVDETGLHVNGQKYWIWIFVTPSDQFAIIRKSRGKKVLMEVLTRKYRGILICDGWKPYPNFTDKIQRCWAHLLREIKYVAESIEEAVALRNGIRRLYEEICQKLLTDPPPEIRKRIWYESRATMNRWLRKHYDDPSVVKLISKIQNGFDHWFTFILNPGLPPTNNAAERGLREQVVQRKIFGTLRNTKGTHVREVTMSVLATWKLQGKNLYQSLRMAL